MIQRRSWQSWDSFDGPKIIDVIDMKILTTPPTRTTLEEPEQLATEIIDTILSSGEARARYILYCLLSTVYCLLSTVYCLLSTVYCLLSTQLSTVYHSLLCCQVHPAAGSHLGHLQGRSCGKWTLLTVKSTRRPRLFLPFGQKKVFMCFFLILRHFWCSVVTSVTFSSNLRTLKKNPKKESKKNPKNSRNCPPHKKKNKNKKIKKIC